MHTFHFLFFLFSNYDEDTVYDNHQSLLIESRLFFWTCVISLMCSLLTMVFITTNSRLPQFKKTSQLERPNVYVGLEKLPPDIARAALPKSLDVFPPVFQPVNRTHPERVFPEDTHAHFTFNGKVTPGDHNVLLSSDVSGHYLPQIFLQPTAGLLLDKHGRPVQSAGFWYGTLCHSCSNTR